MKYRITFSISTPAKGDYPAYAYKRTVVTSTRDTLTDKQVNVLIKAHCTILALSFPDATILLERLTREEEMLVPANTNDV